MTHQSGLPGTPDPFEEALSKWHESWSALSGGWPAHREDGLIETLAQKVPDLHRLEFLLSVAFDGLDRGRTMPQATWQERAALKAEVVEEAARLRARVARNWLAGFRLAVEYDPGAVGALVVAALRDLLRHDPDSVVNLLAEAMQGEFADLTELIYARTTGARK